MHSLLEPREARAPGFVECDDLAVEHGVVHPEIAEQAAHLRVAVGDLPQVAALQA